MTASPARNAAPLPPIQAEVCPLALAQHELQVTLRFPAEAVAKGGVLALPAWTPGSYFIRDYARLLDRLQGEDTLGRPVPLLKLDKQRWRFDPVASDLILSYRLFCRELTVRTNHADAEHAHLVGASTFLALEGEEGRSWEVSFKQWPKDWGVATALPCTHGVYGAPDYDTLVDSPFELGTFRIHRWRHGTTDLELVITGEHGGHEVRLVEGFQSLVAVCSHLFGGLPFPRYVFLLTFSGKARGGLEHRNSTSLLADAHALETPEGYWDLFLLAAHEFFHAWNVKRMRDPVLGSFDYQRENYSRLLWFHEGFTSFMQYGLVLKAGVVPWAWVAQSLERLWTDGITRPGRLEQSLEEASFDAWIRFYRPNEFSFASTVSYYEKGALVGWMMDAQIRQASQGLQGLESLFLELWRRCGDGPVTDLEIRQVYEDLTGMVAAPFWESWIQGTAELEAGDIREAYGLELVCKAPWQWLEAQGEVDPEVLVREKAYTGLVFKGEAPVVDRVVPGSPAGAAGMSYGQEILAVNGWRVSTAAEIQRRCADLPVGSLLHLLAVDRGRVQTYDVPVEETPQRVVRLQPDGGATAAQKAAFRAWTGLSLPRVRKGLR